MFTLSHISNLYPVLNVATFQVIHGIQNSVFGLNATFIYTKYSEYVFDLQIHFTIFTNNSLHSLKSLEYRLFSERN